MIRALFVLLFALFALASCGAPCSETPFELPNPDGGAALGFCDSQWCVIYEADGGTRMIGAP